MKNKKLIQNAPAIISIVLMTAVIVLSSCGNAADSEHASITIRLNGSSSSRAISDAEKSAATFNVYFNDSLVASNVKGTYNGTAQVGTTLKIRLDALVNGKRIARGENTITVMSPSNDVDVRLTENREQGDMQQPAIPYRELSTAQVGDVICANGKVLSANDITTELQSQTIAVVYKVDINARKVWAVGKILSNGMMWAASNAIGYNVNIIALQEENGYTDGSTGLSILQREASDAATDLENMYPAWDYACNYGIKQNLTNFQTGWYLPSKQELQEVYAQKDNMTSSLLNFGTNNYWSSSQYASISGHARILIFGNGSGASNIKNSTALVCAVRQFTW